MQTFEKYFQQELYAAKRLAQSFAKAHPNVAPLLRDKSTDPDVERLLEGVAFLSAQIKERINDQLPEFMGDMMEKFFPHYLRPLPAATIMVFDPSTTVAETTALKEGTLLNSVPIDGVQYPFRTAYPIDVHPLEIEAADWVKRSTELSFIRLDFRLKGTSFKDWKLPERLNLHISGRFPQAANLHCYLLSLVDYIELEINDKVLLRLDADSLIPGGFRDEESILPYPGNAYPAYRLLQEYFILPEKFLFLDLVGLNQLEHKAEDEKFSLKFYFNAVPDELPEIKKDCFYLHAVPALNLFQYDASPIQVNHQQFEYRLVPDEGRVKNATIYNILSVEGFRQGEAIKRVYRHINDRQVGSTSSHLIYKTHVKNSITSDGQDTYLVLFYDVEKELPQPETLSIQLDCTNGHLPEVLSEGEICEASANSPDLMKFRNLYSPSAYKDPPREEEWMWRFQSLLSLNFLSIANRENLQQLLNLYLVTNKGQHVSSVAYERRIESIKNVKVTPVNHLISGIMMRGQEVQIECDVKKFLSFGDMYLFGSLMNYFLSAYVSINTFIDFQMRDSLTGELYKWPIQMGEQLLI